MVVSTKVGSSDGVAELLMLIIKKVKCVRDAVGVFGAIVGERQKEQLMELKLVL